MTNTEFNGEQMASGLKFDEFFDKFCELKQEFKYHHGKFPNTIIEFEEYLKKRKIGMIKRNHLKSLKGFNI